jgi:uncharacterized protein (DUF4415 family)
MPKLKAGTIVPTVAEDKAITAAARKDPDARPLTDAEWKAAKPAARMGRPRKADRQVAVSIRLSPDVLAVLRATGDGWQTRVDTILRERFAL